ncbi:hypothetical protein TRVL_08310 [Trypanosoma vivax]|nr:hypothetical protein TRVL_08310 [Trypanosoma vivax]
MRFGRLGHIAPHCVEAVPRPLQQQRPRIHLLQRQSPLFGLSGRSGNPSASQNAVRVRKRPWRLIFAHGLWRRARQIGRTQRLLYMRPINFAELFEKAAQCPRYRAVLRGSSSVPACFPSCVGALGPKSCKITATAACAGAPRFIECAATP